VTTDAEKHHEAVEMTILARSFEIAKMVEIAATLGIADRLDNGPRPFAELAHGCGADPAMLLRMCRALAAFGVFAVDADGNIGQTTRSALLRQDSRPTVSYAARFLGTPGIWAAWSGMETTIRTGRPAFEAVHGMPFFEYLRTHPDEARLFDGFMQHSPEDRQAAVVEAYDFSTARLVVDVGGGNGALLAAILKANPGARGILFDREAVVASAPEVFEAHVNRCEIRSGDFLQSVPAGGDIYILSQVLHDWSDADGARILGNCRAAIDPSGKLLIVERVLSDVPDRSRAADYLLDMMMMSLFGHARERTLPEFTDLLARTRFARPNAIATRSAFFVLEAAPMA
jgi:hypothetical protein